MRRRNSCEDVRSHLGPFLDDELSAGQAARVARHLSGCPDCQQERAQLAHLKRELGNLPTLSGAAASRNRVFARFRDESVADARVSPWSRVRASLIRPGVAYTLVTATAVAIALAIPIEPLEGSGPVLPDHAELTVLSQRHDLHIARTEGATPGVRGNVATPGSETID